MKHFVIKTLGCKVNQSESENMAASLRKSGLTEPDTASGTTAGRDVDVCIINTCTVTEKASMQSRQAVRQAVRAYPGAKIVVTGCYAQTQPEEIRKIEGVHHIYPQEYKAGIVQRILSKIPAPSSLPGNSWPDASSFSTAQNRGRRTRAFLKIQDGCNAHCTYCIVPKARGGSRSMPEELVFANFDSLRRSGFQEVVLSGIHLGCWGLDLTPATSLLALLEKLDARAAAPRMRISSIEPLELSPEIIDLVARSPYFCRHFHIPLQSGDDGILRRMGRHYDRSFFRDLVMEIHGRLPDAAIGLDVLVGFPGESESAHEQTVALVRELPISYLHVFPFSPRKSTPAYSMDHQIPGSILKERAKRMRAIGDQKRWAFQESMIGRAVNVLVEGPVADRPALYRGRTSHYITVRVEGYPGPGNEIVRVQLKENIGKAGVCGSVI